MRMPQRAGGTVARWIRLRGRWATRSTWWRRRIGGAGLGLCRPGALGPGKGLGRRGGK